MIFNEFELSYGMIVRAGLQEFLEPADTTGEEMRYTLKGGPEVSVTFQYRDDWTAKLRWKLDGNAWVSAIWVMESEAETFLDTLSDLLSRLKSGDLPLPEPGQWDYEKGSLVSKRKALRANIDIEKPVKGITSSGEAMADLHQAMQYLARQFEGQPATHRNLEELSRRMQDIRDRMGELGDQQVNSTITVTTTDGTQFGDDWSAGTDGGES